MLYLFVCFAIKLIEAYKLKKLNGMQREMKVKVSFQFMSLP